MKKFICMMLVCVLMQSLAACGGKETASLSTDGSTSMQKVINALGEAFMEDTGANFTYNATGSGTGIKAVKDGTCDIGLSSRYLKDSEKAEGLRETILAIDGIAIIVHTDNTVANLTVEQIAASSRVSSPTGVKWAARTARSSALAVSNPPAPVTALSPSPTPRMRASIVRS